MPVSFVLAAATIAATWSAPATASAAPTAVDCSAELRIAPASVPGAPLTADDLAGLVDLGTIPDLADDSFFSLSPDGKMLAVSVRKAIPRANVYCTGIYVGPTAGSLKLIDSGVGVVFWRFADLLGKADFPSGFPKPITPRWSPDGRSLAFLKSIDGIAQVWSVAPGGADGRALTHMSVDVQDFRYRRDGHAIVVRSEDASEQVRALGAEALRGFHYDDRFSPMASSRPFLRGPLPVHSAVVDVDGGASDAVMSDDGKPFDVSNRETPTGSNWTAVEDTDASEAGVAARDRNGHVARCRDRLCSHVEGHLWTSADGKQIRFVRLDGPALDAMSIYGWDIGSPRPRRLFSTGDLLVDCTPLGDDVICGREASTRPRYLSRIDLHTGRSTALFDPNPGFGARLPGRVERLTWRNRFGIESFGDLVYPAGYRAGHTYPLIVVQYTSRGFLRGGTGDEFPVQLFAGHGFAVLNIQHPRSPIPARRGMSVDEEARLDLKDFVERRSILSTFETIVARLVAGGIVDPKRIGITGLSDGASTVQFAMVHSHTFKVASIGSCCWEPSQAWTLGPAIQDYYRSIGWPSSTGDHRSFWAQISLARNTDKITAPVLVQASDDEYQIGLESVAALRERGRAVDLYVFPDEHHVKRQPAHRLAVYQRNLDWFSFWLKDEYPRYAPDHDAEYARWLGLRRAHERSVTHDLHHRQPR